MSEKTKLIFFYILGFPKTLYINFRVLPFFQALKLPIIVSHKTYFKSLKGEIDFKNPSFACLKIGFGSTQTTDFFYDRTILDIRGKIIVRGKCRIGAGNKIHIKGLLDIGDNFNMSGSSTIVCNKTIATGKHVLISWEVLIMDTDQHRIFNSENEIINEDRKITIGSGVWLGARSTIVKGTEIGNNIVVAAGSLVVGKHSQSNTVIAGNPAKVVKKDVWWE